MPDRKSIDLDTLSFLVIEDDAFARSLAVGLLRKMGTEKVDVAENGVAALDYLARGDAPPDVLLVDLGMPDMGGVEMMRLLAESTYEGGIILVSGAEEETLIIAQELAKSRGLNVLGLITKPLTEAALMEALST